MKGKDYSQKKSADSFGTYLQVVQNISSKTYESRDLDINKLLSESEAQDTAEEVPEEEIQGKELMTLISTLEPTTISELMRQSPLNFLDFARQLNVLVDVGLVELTSSESDPDAEIVQLSRLGRQTLSIEE